MVTVPEPSGYQGLFFQAPALSLKAAESPAAHRVAGGAGWQVDKGCTPRGAVAVATSLLGTRDIGEETSLLEQISS